jgi:hypothetical protein
MYGLLEGKSRTNSDESRNWRLDISPAGMASLALDLNRSKRSVPVASFSYRF